ncbi:MAG: gliding motility-associated C-terminal domain-containing protein, partial [Saprospiraceae bacterium]|nr:gliding motility-associated C-terminal domain-containing protein [Saprospiraceae bacterium]
TQILTVLPPPEVQLINPPVYSVPLTCQEALTFTAPNISYSNNSACISMGTLSPVITPNYSPCGGNININWTGTDACNRPILYNQIIVVLPAAAPTLTGTLPQDITVSCNDLSAYQIPLNYSNALSGSCLLNGSIQGQLTQPDPICGGIATIVWTGQDACGNNLSHTQNITILPAPAAVFTNLPPANLTLTCNLVPTQIPSLTYTNNANGACLISGSAPALVTGNFDACGGLIQYTWQFTDQCGRSIVHNQNITVLPAGGTPAFQDVPVDIVLPCGVTTFDAPVELYYSNGLSGSCSVSGISAAVIQDFGSSQVYTWSFVNPCNNQVITAEQTVSTISTPNIIINPGSVQICAGQSFNLSSIIVTDLNNNTNNVITYHTGSPATNANKLSSPIIIANAGQLIYIIKATNSAGCSDEAVFSLIINDQVNAGTGLNGNECIDNSPVNLWSYLSGTYNPGGDWYYTGTANINISNPGAVNFGSADPGVYIFQYVVEGLSGCPNDTAFVQLNLQNPGTYAVSSVSCSPDFQSYTVSLTSVGYSVTSNFGTVTPGAGNTYTISNIPISQTVSIVFTSLNASCAAETSQISPPNCNCPNISQPVSGGDLLTCLNTQNVSLTVTTTAGLSTNWYSAQTGGTLLAANTLSYIPSTDMTGIFTYYAEAFDPVTNCKSSIKTPVTIEIVGLPGAQNVEVNSCDNNMDGFTSFDIDGIKSQISATGSNQITFHLTQSDAQSSTNPISSPFTNTALNQTIYSSVKNSNNCISTGTVKLTAVSPPSFTLNITNESCLGSKDGSITVMAAGQNLYQLDNLPYSSNTSFNDLSPKDYTVSVKNAFDCINTSVATIQPGQILELTTFSIICNNNGTSSLSTDDYYDISFIVTNTTSATNKFEVFFNGISKGTYNYNILNNITLSANGVNGLLEFKDLVLGCKTSKVVNNLTPCSTDCKISYTDFSLTCNNNNTAADATDDYYTLTFKASALNGSANNTFNVLVDGVIVGNYSYNTTVAIKLNADGSIPIVILRDNEDLQCVLNVPINALISCSSSCLITKTISNILCNDNGTINDPTDDRFTFDIKVIGSNVSATWLLSGDITPRQYNTSYKLGPFSIAAGVYNATISDGANALCTSPIIVTPPAVCSEPCVLEVLGLNIGPCNDNGTGSNDNDDIFSISFTVKLVSGSANFYYVTDGVKIFGPFTYGQQVTISNLKADGNNITLNVYDGINSGCKQTFVVSKPSCSSCNHTLDAGQNITLTCSQNTATLSATSDMIAIYTWTGPNGFVKTGISVTTSTPGQYYVTALFSDQCTLKDSVQVTKDSSLPIANAGPDQEITCKITNVQLTGTTNLTNNVKYIWTNAAGNEIGTGLNVNVSEPGFYYFEVINTTTNCSSGKDEVEVIDNRSKPDAIIFADPGNLLNCKIATIRLYGQPEIDVIFNWQFGENVFLNQPEISINKVGIVTMTAIDTISGCENIAQLEIINIQEYPILVISPVKEITCETNKTVISAENSPSGPNLIYSWFDVNNQQIPDQNGNTLTVNNEGTYYVVLTDTLNGCSNKDTIIVTKTGNFPSISVSDDLILNCGKKDANLTVTILNPTETPLILWTTVDGNIAGSNTKSELATTDAGTYQVEVTYPSTGCKSTDQVNISLNNNYPTAVIFQAEDETCLNEKDGMATISEIKGGEEPTYYTLNGLKNAPLTNLSPGVYNLEIIDKNNCKTDTSFTIKQGNVFEVSSLSPIELLLGQTQILSIITSLDTADIASVTWVPSENLSCDTCLTTTVTARQNIIYQVTVIDIYGCSETLNIEIRVKDNTVITVPNIINTSGNDNKFFTLYGNILSIKKMSIYDRWGNLVFQKENFAPNLPSEGWNGKFNNEDVVPGVFVYSIHYETISGIKIISGDLTVIR